MPLQHGQGQVLHLQGDHAVIPCHTGGEEGLLPPLDTVARAHRHVIPALPTERADGLGIQHPVGAP